MRQKPEQGSISRNYTILSRIRVSNYYTREDKCNWLRIIGPRMADWGRLTLKISTLTGVDIQITHRTLVREERSTYLPSCSPRPKTSQVVNFQHKEVSWYFSLFLCSSYLRNFMCLFVCMFFPFSFAIILHWRLY